MELNELIVRIENCINDDFHLEFDKEIYRLINRENVDSLYSKLSNKIKLMYLPHHEINFFEWLRENDLKVWEDLWKTDDINEKPYLVSFSFLPYLIKEKERGFPICDLRNNDNYYFTEKQMVDAESKTIIEAAKQRFNDREKMEIAHQLALEISTGGIDVWHFAYKYNVEVKEVKKAVKILVDDNALVHLTDAEHLAALMEF